MGIEPTSEATGARVGLVGIMPPPCRSVQIDRGGSGNGVFGALRARATISRSTRPESRIPAFFLPSKREFPFYLTQTNRTCIYILLLICRFTTIIPRTRSLRSLAPVRTFGASPDL